MLSNDSHGDLHFNLQFSYFQVGFVGLLPLLGNNCLDESPTQAGENPLVVSSGSQVVT